MDTAKSLVENGCIQYYKEVKLYEDHTNSRLKILDYSCITVEVLLDIIRLAGEKKLGKVISNCQTPLLKPFREAGFTVEGMINGFFRGEDAFCVSYFIDKDQSISLKKLEEDAILYECTGAKAKRTFTSNCEDKFEIRDALPRDIPQMVDVFAATFETYPSPIFDGSYIKSAMDSHVLFKVALHDKKIVSAASADMDYTNLNAEITDCATYPEYRGQGLLSNLVYSLELDLKPKGFYALYSLSRAMNPGINAVLSKQGYRCTGRLVNNCHICGGFEDMNIWVKKLKVLKR